MTKLHLLSFFYSLCNSSQLVPNHVLHSLLNVWPQDEKAAREAAEARVAQLEADLAEAKSAAQAQVRVQQDLMCLLQELSLTGPSLWLSSTLASQASS